MITVLTACNPKDTPNGSEFRVEVVVDGTRSTFTYNRSTSVSQFLDEIDIVLNSLDDVNPPRFTPISDGMTITIVRITEETACEDQEAPYEEKQFSRTDMEPDETVIVQQGVPGIIQVCVRIEYRDGIEVRQVTTSRTMIRPPEDLITYVGVEDNLDPVPIEGTLAYISNGQAYIMRTTSGNRHVITPEGGLDGYVFELSSNGRQLLFTRSTPDPNDQPFSNELWAVLDTTTPNPVLIDLPIPDVLTAAWRPNFPGTFSYSTANGSNSFLGWDAYNDLFFWRINEQDGSVIDVETVIEDNLIGNFAIWGTKFAWSPNGEQLAYAKADGVGLVDIENGDFLPFNVSYPHYATAVDNGWVWETDISWSQDGEWVILTAHGPPFGAEDPTHSSIFNIAVFRADGTLVIESLINQAGIWSAPRYSPLQLNDLDFEDFKIAYLQARDPLSSYSGEYDLYVADRDGSNPRRIFPVENQPGLRPINAEGELFAWSPSGRQIAIVYQGNLWIVEVETGRATQVTPDGGVASPRWTP
jgi:Tol biopolymer transport system component